MLRIGLSSQLVVGVGGRIAAAVLMVFSLPPPEHTFDKWQGFVIKEQEESRGAPRLCSQVVKQTDRLL